MADIKKMNNKYNTKMRNHSNGEKNKRMDDKRKWTGR